MKTKILLLSLFVMIVGCSKSNSDEDNYSSKGYTVPVELTINGVTRPSKITISDATPLGYCTNDFMLVTNTNVPYTDAFDISMVHFKEAGFEFNGNEATIGEEQTNCDAKELVINAPNDKGYLSKAVGGGQVTVSGKNYTLTCYAKNIITPTDNTIYTITATWTRP